MNKTLNTVILFFLGQSVIAQKGIDNLIRAEKDFAAYSVTHNTKEAFLQFIDSNSIMFDEGKPVTAFAFWNKREKKPGRLNWHPQYAEISASEDFGYTTGPWTFQLPGSDSIIARGQYSTVWHLNKKGEWKFLIDFGIDNTQPGSDEERIIDVPKNPGTPEEMTNVHPLMGAEKHFNALLEKNKKKAYKTFLSAQNSILMRNGFLPAVSSTAKEAIIRSTPSGLKFTTDGMGSSAIQDKGFTYSDIAYTYGSVMINGKPENYIRIWRKENGRWKLALEVMRY